MELVAVQSGVSAAEARGDEELALQAARSGELTGFASLVRLHQASVFSLALRLLGVREDAQELAQDVFMQLYRHVERIESHVHLRFWLRRAVCHRAIDRLRRRPPVPLMPLEAAAAMPGPNHDPDPLLERRLRELLALLPPTPRSVLLLRYQEDLDPPQIARTLQMPLNTVKSHLRRALQVLRARCALEGLATRAEDSHG